LALPLPGAIAVTALGLGELLELPLAQALNWLYVLLQFLTMVGGLCWWWRLPRPLRSADIPALLALALMPLAYTSLSQAGLFFGDLLRWTRPSLAWVPTLAAIWVLVLLTYAHQPVGARALQRAVSTLATLGLGALVAGVELGDGGGRLAVMVAIDTSRSIDLVRDADSRVRKELELARTSMRDGDRLGVLVFGSTAQLLSPLQGKQPAAGAQMVSVNRDATDIEAALRRGLSELPPDAAGKLVLISDGAETRGDSERALELASAAGVPVDTVALDQESYDNVRVVSVSAPPTARSGETFAIRVVLESSVDTRAEVRSVQDGEITKKWTVSLHAGQEVLTLPHTARGNGLRRYEIHVSAPSREVDQVTEDNQRSAFVRVRGVSRALILSKDPAQARALEAALLGAELQVHNGGLQDLASSAAGLAGYDLVVLRDLPARLLSPGQLSALSQYVRALGGGLLLMGSDDSFGVGGYNTTPLETISPVSFDLKQDRRRGTLAEVIAIDHSGSMAATVGASTKLELANEAAFRSAKLLGATDRLGILHVDTSATWTVPLNAPPDPEQLRASLEATDPAGGGIFVDVALQQAYQVLRGVDTNLKHVLLFTDGSDAENTIEAERLVQAAQRRGISTSVVALGRGPDLPALERLSAHGRGRFYIVEDARRLASVFAQETMLATRNALRELEFVPTVLGSPGVLSGVDFADAPALRGYVVTLPKARAQVFLQAPDNDPLLAAWRVGLGQVAAFTSDYSSRWGSEWIQWPDAAQLFAQLGRSLARRLDEPGVRLRASVQGGTLNLVADVLDERGALDSHKSLAAHIAGPGGAVSTTALPSVSPGRYEAQVPLDQPGAYAISGVELTSGKLLATVGAELSAADELARQGSNRELLRHLAEGSGGHLRDTLAGLFNDRGASRQGHRSPILTLSWLVGALVLLSVLLRRIQLPRLRWPTEVETNAGASNAEAPGPDEVAVWGDAADDRLDLQRHAWSPGHGELSAAEVLLKRRRRMR
jgi:Ca-activated chloride channel homolog